MATKTAKKKPAAKKTTTRKSTRPAPTAKGPSRALAPSAATEGSVLMMALSWQESSAAYQFPSTPSQRVLGIDPTCPQCPARSCEKGIMLSRTIPPGSEAQVMTPTRAMVFEFENYALADSWFAADGAKFDLVKVIDRL